jgi:hypothetical protein
VNRALRTKLKRELETDCARDCRVLQVQQAQQLAAEAERVVTERLSRVRAVSDVSARRQRVQSATFKDTLALHVELDKELYC